MRPTFFGFLLVLLLFGIGWYVMQGAGAESSSTGTTRPQSFTEQEAGFEDEPGSPMYRIGGGRRYTLEELRTWERPDGPPRVGLQVGHLKNDEVPQELSGLTRNGAGATAAGLNERDTVAVITELVAEELLGAGLAVDVLPATVPPGYVADVFLSIHADGNPNTAVRGFKIAGPRRDYSGRSKALVASLEGAYAAATSLPQDPQVTRRMTTYYAFNWPRYEHAIHPFTPAAIVETGFLTNPNDRALLVNDPATVAAGIAEGVQAFLVSDVSRQPLPTPLTAPTLPLSGTVACAPLRAEERNDPEDDHTCRAALQTAAGDYYMLVAEPPIATSSLPYPATVTGEYMPIQVLDYYFWFDYEASGMIEVQSIERADA